MSEASKPREILQPVERVPQVYQAIQRVIQGIGKVEKSQQKYQNYQYYAIDDIFAAIKGPCIEHGLLIAPHLDWFETQIRDTETIDSQTGEATPMTTVFCQARVEVRFIAVADGSQLVCHGFGHGIDRQDKAPGKAFSYAVKNVLLSALMLRGHVEPESDSINVGANASQEPSSARQKTVLSDPALLITPEQRETIEGLLNDPRTETVLVRGVTLASHLKVMLHANETTADQAGKAIAWAVKKLREGEASGA